MSPVRSDGGPKSAGYPFPFTKELPSATTCSPLARALGFLRFKSLVSGRSGSVINWTERSRKREVAGSIPAFHRSNGGCSYTDCTPRSAPSLDSAPPGRSESVISCQERGRGFESRSGPQGPGSSAGRALKLRFAPHARRFSLDWPRQAEAIVGYHWFDSCQPALGLCSWELPDSHPTLGDFHALDSLPPGRSRLVIGS